MNNENNLIYNGMVEVIMSKKDKALKEFRESLDPNMDEMEKFFLIEEFKYKRDEDTIQAMCYDRVDGDERRLAFWETLLTAIQTDGEDWETKSNDIYWALQTNSAERLLIGLCGWGANSLAKLARIVPIEEADLISCDDSATLIVRWNDGKISTSECSINTFTFEVEEFEDEVFTSHAYDSEVEAVFVEVKLELSDSKYCFACITEEERERTSDEFSYWYSLKRDNDD